MTSPPETAPPRDYRLLLPGVLSAFMTEDLPHGQDAGGTEKQA
jgi:hypothetical protein